MDSQHQETGSLYTVQTTSQEISKCEVKDRDMYLDSTINIKTEQKPMNVLPEEGCQKSVDVKHESEDSTFDWIKQSARSIQDKHLDNNSGRQTGVKSECGDNAFNWIKIKKENSDYSCNTTDQPIQTVYQGSQTEDSLNNEADNQSTNVST